MQKKAPQSPGGQSAKQNGVTKEVVQQPSVQKPVRKYETNGVQEGNHTSNLPTSEAGDKRKRSK